MSHASRTLCAFIGRINLHTVWVVLRLLILLFAHVLHEDRGASRNENWHHAFIQKKFDIVDEIGCVCLQQATLGNCLVKSCSFK